MAVLGGINLLEAYLVDYMDGTAAYIASRFPAFFLGAVLTLLAVSNCTHKQSYMDICVSLGIIPVIVSLVLSFVRGLFI